MGSGTDEESNLMLANTCVFALCAWLKVYALGAWQSVCALHKNDMACRGSSSVRMGVLKKLSPSLLASDAKARISKRML